MGSLASVFNGISANEFAVCVASFFGSMPLIYNMMNGRANRLPTSFVAGIALVSFLGSDAFINDGEITDRLTNKVVSAAQTMALNLQS